MLPHSTHKNFFMKIGKFPSSIQNVFIRTFQFGNVTRTLFPLILFQVFVMTEAERGFARARSECQYMMCVRIVKLW